MQRPKSPAPWLIVLALITVQVLFGVNYVVSKIVVGAFPPLVWASARIIVASIVMIGAAALLRPGARPPWSKDFFVPMIVFALLGSVINQASFLVGLSYTTSTNSAILNTLIPVFTLLIVTVRGQEPLTVRRAIGFVLALGGVLILRKIENFTFSDQTLVGDLLTVLNCFSYGLFLSYSKKFLEKYDRIWTTAWLFIYGSVGLTAIATPGWMAFTPPLFTGELLAAMAFAILGGTLMTYFLNVWTLAHTKSTSVAIFIYLQPIVAIALAYFWKDEPITGRAIFSSALIFVGVLLSLSPQQQRAPAEPALRVEN